MSGREVPIGPVGRRVGEAIRTARLRRGMKLTELSGELARHGRHIALNGLSRIERGERRLDVDDLAALALSLGVPMAELLGPDTGSAGTGVETLRVLYDALMHRGHEGTRAPCDVCAALDEARRALAGAP